MSTVAISDKEFDCFRRLIYQTAGIHLAPVKKTLVVGRLNKRLRHYGIGSFEEYFRVVTSGNEREELQTVVDLLTTNETYFFREPKHFDFLRDRILPQHPAGRSFRAWSAAASSGEEAYSLGMVCESHLPASAKWEILGTDVSRRMLERARRGLYPDEAAAHIPREFLRRFCLKGVRSQSGYLLVDKAIRSGIRFESLNLNGSWPDVGQFDVIFLRNVMIYFDRDTKRALVERMYQRLRPGGHLFVGHSETLNGVSDRFKLVQPAVYRRSE